MCSGRLKLAFEVLLQVSTDQASSLFTWNVLTFLNHPQQIQLFPLTN